MDDHLDADINVRQQMSWPVLISLLGLALGTITGGAGIYTTLMSNDRELYAGQAQLKQEVQRLEAEKRELKSKIRNDLKDLNTAVAQVRDLLIQKLGPFPQAQK